MVKDSSITVRISSDLHKRLTDTRRRMVPFNKEGLPYTNSDALRKLLSIGIMHMNAHLDYVDRQIEERRNTGEDLEY